ncbi:MAG: sigma-70 family RNA polymerase sigma factor [Burkholderiaceae bacterium]|nr:sigma-70 family RNA polymerase sigma factor [Burkholderiaceae bacterium]
MIDAIDAQLAEHAGLVRQLARRMFRRLPASVELDDLIQVGMLGLAQAIERFDPAAADFRRFAARRITGAMLDHLREGDPLRRARRDLVNAGDAATRRLWHTLGRKPLESEIAAAIGVTLAEYQGALAALGSLTTVSLDDAHDAESDADSPFDTLLRQERMGHIERACQRLGDQDRTVVRGVLIEGRRLSEIAADLGVTVAAVCHRRDRLTARLRLLLAPQGV